MSARATFEKALGAATWEEAMFAVTWDAGCCEARLQRYVETPAQAPERTAHLMHAIAALQDAKAWFRQAERLARRAHR